MEGNGGHQVLARASLFVLDASVAVKWFVKEPLRTKALRVRADYLEDKIELKAPGLIWYEVGNALKFHPGATSQLVSSSVRTIEDMQIIEADNARLDTESVARIAFEEKITFYDATYLALAEKHACQLLTDDRLLYKKLGKRRHLLQLLEDYRPATTDKHGTALRAAAGLDKGTGAFEEER